MMKTGAVPFFVSLVLYLVVSINNPIQGADSQMMAGLQEVFVISYWAFLPAVLMLVLPLFKVDVLLSMGLSILSSVLISIFVQGQGIMEVVRTLIFGYKAGEGTAASILDGGGLLSMVEIIIILLVSGAYSGIFEGTNMLRGVNDKISSLCVKIGRLPVTMIMGLGSAVVFCNQTIATLMVGSLMKGTYRESGASGEELAIDMENSVILISCMVPWCIGCSVPLGFFGVGWSAMKYAFYMFLVPIVYLFTKRFFYGSKKHD
jgi:NhaC family Na+:H+ antiporter